MDYEIKRTMMWFYKGQKVNKSDLLKYFTNDAIKKLIESKYLRKIPVKRSTSCCNLGAGMF